MCQSPHTQAPHGPTSVSFPARGTFSSLSLSRFFSNNGCEQAAIITSTQGYHGSYCGVFGENARRCFVLVFFFNFFSVWKSRRRKKKTHTGLKSLSKTLECVWPELFLLTCGGLSGSFSLIFSNASCFCSYNSETDSYIWKWCFLHFLKKYTNLKHSFYLLRILTSVLEEQ